MNKLLQIQNELKAPKSQYNSFGKYNYRNCEDILEAVKPLLNKYSATLFISDEIVEMGGRFYVKATATFIDGDIQTKATAYAREAADKKGMDEAQITGAASSYARKYALNGLFLIDDTKDADSTNTHGKEEPKGDKDFLAKKEAERAKLRETMEAMGSAAPNRPTEASSKAQDAPGEESGPSTHEPIQKTISGLNKKFYPKTGNKPYAIMVDGKYYTSYHEGVAKQMKDTEGKGVHVTYHEVAWSGGVNLIADKVEVPE